MTTTQSDQPTTRQETPMSKLTFTPTAIKLLRQIADHDAGAGVAFKLQPRARYQHPHTNHIFNGRTFWPLDKAGLIDIGDGGNDTPVKVTPAGREWLAANTTPCPAP
jgi:hypothetical protein